MTAMNPIGTRVQYTLSLLNIGLFEPSCLRSTDFGQRLEHARVIQVGPPIKSSSMEIYTVAVKLFRTITCSR